MLRTADFLRSQTSAPGKVLGPWDWGHLFDVVGGRAVVLDNFGASIGRTDFENANGMTLATREKFVATYCAAQGVRFVILQNPQPYYPARAEASGLPRRAFLTPPSASSSRPMPTPLMRSTFWWRAYFEGGRGRPGRGPAGTAFDDFRLVRVETERETSNLGSAVQIWQFVPHVPLSPSK